MNSYGWQTVPSVDSDHPGMNNNDLSLLEESLVGYPKEGSVLPQASSTAHIQVVAPATLPEGYEFDAAIGQTTMKVIVPPGGIEKGQTFTVSITPEQLIQQQQNRKNVVGASPSFNTIHIPVGHWRDGELDLFRYGACHPHCWTSCCCSLIAAGQIITRLQLTWCGKPATTPSQSAAAFSIVFTITLIHFASLIMLYITVASLDPNDYGEDEPPEGWIKPTGLELVILQIYNLLKYSYWIITGLWLFQLRTILRAKYAIPGASGTDCLCSFCCPCLIAGQMLRHTTDYDVYPSYLCSPTGLPSSAPLLV